MEQKNLDALLVSQSENRRYLSQFKGSAGWLIITKKNAYLAVDFRYTEQAKREVADGLEVRAIIGDATEWLTDFLANSGLQTIGFESGALSYDFTCRLSDKLHNISKKAKLVPCKDIVERIRSVKDKEELKLIAKAAELADSALRYAQTLLKPGITEKGLAWELEKWLRVNGSEPLPFDIIVASGLNASLPHHQPSEKIIEPDEAIVIDLGARINGYCSDITRTLFLEMHDETFFRIYDIVLSAQLTGLSLIKSGMTGGQADQLSRIVIDTAGHQDHFGHGLGHGLGLAIHEIPAIRPKSEDILTDNMVFTIEPGIYISGWGGIRIEDTVMLNQGKLLSLTRAEK